MAFRFLCFGVLLCATQISNAKTLVLDTLNLQKGHRNVVRPRDVGARPAVSFKSGKWELVVEFFDEKRRIEIDLSALTQCSPSAVVVAYDMGGDPRLGYAFVGEGSEGQGLWMVISHGEKHYEGNFYGVAGSDLLNGTFEDQNKNTFVASMQYRSKSISEWSMTTSVVTLQALPIKIENQIWYSDSEKGAGLSYSHPSTKSQGYCYSPNSNVTSYGQGGVFATTYRSKSEPNALAIAFVFGDELEGANGDVIASYADYKSSHASLLIEKAKP